MSRKKKQKVKFPRLAKLGVSVHDFEGYPVADSESLHDALKAKGDAFYNRFQKLFGVQTVMAEGPFAYDAEAVLERMATGKRTGTQLHWD